MAGLLSRPDTKRGQQIAHVKAWRRHRASVIRELWNAGVPMKDICARLNVSEVHVDHVIRGNVCRDAGPAVTPRRMYGRNQRQQMRDLVEVPG